MASCYLNVRTCKRWGHLPVQGQREETHNRGYARKQTGHGGKPQGEPDRFRPGVGPVNAALEVG